MKQWLIGALALVVLMGIPFRKYDTEKLLPIQCVQAQRVGNEIHILSEGGEGFGSTWMEAVEDLRKNAAGEVFFDTAEQAVFSDMELAVEAAESGVLRPAAEVFIRKGMEDPEKLYRYYSQHGSHCKISDLRGKGGKRPWQSI